MSSYKANLLLFLLITLSHASYAQLPEVRGSCAKINSTGTSGREWHIYLKDEVPLTDEEKLVFVYQATSADTVATFDLSTPVTLSSGYQLKYRNGEVITNIGEHIGVFMELKDGNVEEVTSSPKNFPRPEDTTRYVRGKAFYRLKQDLSIYANGTVKVTARWRITCN